MADAKISALTAIASVATEDLLPIVDDPSGTPVTKKATVAQLRTALFPASLTTDVTGTLPVANGGTGATTHTSGSILKGAGAGAITSFAPGAGVETFLTTPSSANLAAAVTDETGTGALVFANTPTLVTPVIGAATGTSAALTGFWSTGATPATTGAGRMTDNESIYARSGVTNYRLLNFSGGQLNIGESGAGVDALVCYGQTSISLAIGTTTIVGVTSAGLRLNDGGGQYLTLAMPNLAADRTLTFPLLAGNDTAVAEAFAQTLTNKTIPAGSNTISGIADANIDAAANIALSKTALSANARTFLATPSSANMATLVTDETGSGSLVFAISPTLVTPTLGVASATSVAASSFLSAGGTVATAGALRLANAGVIAARNAADSADVTALTVDSSNRPVLGTSSNDTHVTGANVYANGASHVWRSANGATTFGSIDANSFLTLDQAAAVIRIGTTYADAGTIRLANTATIRGRNAANSANITWLESDASNFLYIGTDAAFTASAAPDTVRLNANTATIIGNQGSRHLTANGQTNVLIGFPLVGDTAMTSPWGKDGVAEQAMGDANQTLASSVYAYGMVKTTGAITANRTITYPGKSDVQGYQKWVNNTCTGAFSIVVAASTGSGGTVTIGNGKTAAVWIDSRGVTRLTADV